MLQSKNTKIFLLLSLLFVLRANIPNCENALSGVCSECSAGFHLNNNNECVEIANEIVDCLIYDSVDSTICDQCVAGKIFFEGSCQGLANCDVPEILNDELVCSQCSFGYTIYYDDVDPICREIIEDCIYHQYNSNTQTYFCAHCRVGMYKNSDNTGCIRLDIPNAKTISSNSNFVDDYTIDSCRANYRVTDDLQKCLKDIEGCDVYMASDLNTTQFECDTCNGDYIKSDNNLCYKEIYGNCEEHGYVDGELVCTLCYNADITVFQAPFGCIVPIDHCLEYSEDSTNEVFNVACTVCEEGYVLDEFNQFCTKVIENCDVQIGFNFRFGYINCETCSVGFVKTIGGDQCLPEIANCELYEQIPDDSLTALCQKCASGYILNATKDICVMAITDCFDHEITDGVATCLTCDGSKIPSEDGSSCMEGIPHCMTINFETDPISCTECEANFVLSEDFLSCEPSLDNCTTATYDEVEQMVKCTTCDDGFIKTTDEAACLAEITNCTEHNEVPTANDDVTCNTCEDSFIPNVSSTECVVEISNCDSQSTAQDDTQQCDACAVGYTVSDDLKSCKMDIENCDVMVPAPTENDSHTCTTCVDGYIPNSVDQTTCITPIANCTSQSADADGNEVCDECDAGYSPSDDNMACFMDIENCTTQINAPTHSDMNHTCEVCNEGYVVTSSSDACVEAIENCMEHIYENDISKCMTCMDGFVLTSDQLACNTEIMNCMTHTEVDSNTALTCEECESGFILNNDATVCNTAIMNCEVHNIETDPMTCTTCEFGFNLTNNNTECTPRYENCEVFGTNQYGITVCTQCHSSYILSYDERACFQIIPNCSIYYNIRYTGRFSRCQTCENNYTTKNGYFCQIQSKTCGSEPIPLEDPSTATVDLSTLDGKIIKLMRVDNNKYLNYLDGNSVGTAPIITQAPYDYTPRNEIMVESTGEEGIFNLSTTANINVSYFQSSTSISQLLSLDAPTTDDFKWQFIATGDNKFLIKNVETELYMDDNGMPNCQIEWEVTVVEN